MLASVQQYLEDGMQAEPVGRPGPLCYASPDGGFKLTGTADK